jgi:hypothetical protein
MKIKNQILIPILVSKFWVLANWCTGGFRFTLPLGEEGLLE